MAMATAMAIASAPDGVSEEAPVRPLRVLVAVNEEQEHLLAARVEGQATDLEVDIIVLQVGPGLEPDQLAAAALDAAEARGAQVTIWFVAEGDGWVVSVHRGPRTFRRLVTESRGAMSSSASVEAVGVAVRTTLRGVVAGEHVPEGPPPEPAPPSVRFVGGVGWTMVLDRPWSAGHHGVEARVGVGLGAWRIGLLFAEHPFETIEVSDATLQLERQVGALMVGHDFRLGPRWRLGAAVGVEVLRFPRVTSTVAGGLTATTPQSSLNAAVRPEVELAFELGWSLWVSLRLGGEFLFHRPVFGVGEPGGVVRPIASLWWVQPTATLALGVEWPSNP